MPADVQQILTLLLFFTAVALCMWRMPHGDRWHLALCAIAALIWASLPVLEPRTRTPMFAFIVGGFLMTALARHWQRRES